MKNVRFLLIIIAMVSFLSAHAQGLAQRPEIKMQSTSAGLVCSGSTLPSAAIHGTYVTGTTIGTYSSTNASGPRHAKKEGEEDPFGGQTIGGTTNPMEPATPLGDAALPLILLACVYICARAFLRRKRA